MNISIWYVSKYVATPGMGSVGSRGYLIMRELARMGHDVSIITSDSNKLAATPKLDRNFLFQKLDGMDVVWVRTIKYSVGKSVSRILSWLHFEWGLIWLPKSSLPKPDVIIVSSLSMLTILTGLWWKFRYRARLILEVRDIWPLTIVEEGGFSQKNPFVMILSLIEWLGYRYADEIVGTMPNLSSHIWNVLGFKRPVHCIPMGLDENIISGSVEYLSESYLDQYIPREKFIVVHSGSVGITNALDTFFECAVAMKNNKNIHFLIVGDGDLKEGYQRDYGHLDNLTFAPRVNKYQVNLILKECDLLYFSTHESKVWEYGQSLNKLVDYMWAGKPIIGSYSGFPSMINEAKCGEFLTAGDVYHLKTGIEKYAAKTPREREAIGCNGRKWLLKHRRYEVLARHYLPILEG